MGIGQGHFRTELNVTVKFTEYGGLFGLFKHGLFVILHQVVYNPIIRQIDQLYINAHIPMSCK